VSGICRKSLQLVVFINFVFSGFVFFVWVLKRKEGFCFFFGVMTHRRSKAHRCGFFPFLSFVLPTVCLSVRPSFRPSVRPSVVEKEDVASFFSQGGI